MAHGNTPINTAFGVPRGISLGDNALVIDTDTAPNAGPGIEAPLGSFAIQADGTWWQKTTGPDTGWTVANAGLIEDLDPIAIVGSGMPIVIDATTSGWYFVWTDEDPTIEADIHWKGVTDDPLVITSSNAVGDTKDQSNRVNIYRDTDASNELTLQNNTTGSLTLNIRRNKA